MTLESDIAHIAEQERRLCLPAFDNATAWELGAALREAAAQRGVAVAIEIRLAGQTVFFHAMPGTAPTNADWARRKRNTVELLHHSSYGVGLSLKHQGSSLEASMGLPQRDYASHGGAFPITVTGCGCIGVITVSGLPQREDHEMVCAVLARHIGLDPAEVALG